MTRMVASIMRSLCFILTYQQALAAAMAAQTIIAASMTSPLTFSNSHHPFQSEFKGSMVRIPQRVFSFAPAARALTVVTKTKKVVAVLKGNSQVEGVVIILQEDNGVPFDLFSPLFAVHLRQFCAKGFGFVSTEGEIG